MYFSFLSWFCEVAPIPLIDLRVRVLGFCNLELAQFRNLGVELRLNAGDEIVDEGLRRGPVLRHFDFGLEIIPRFVAELERDLVAVREDVVQQRHVLLAREIESDLVKMLPCLLVFCRFLDRVVMKGHVGEDGVGVVAGLHAG